MIEAVLAIVENAVLDAMEEHAPMNSAHEGIYVIREEYDELWDEIKKKRIDNDKLLKEASHVAATAVRFMIEVCLADDTTESKDKEEA